MCVCVQCWDIENGGVGERVGADCAIGVLKERVAM